MPVSLPRRCIQSQGFRHQPGASHTHIYGFRPSIFPELLTQHLHLGGPQTSLDCPCPKPNSSLFTPQPPPSPVIHSPSCSIQKLGGLSSHPPSPHCSLHSMQQKSRHFFLRIWPPVPSALTCPLDSSLLTGLSLPPSILHTAARIFLVNCKSDA